MTTDGNVEGERQLVLVIMGVSGSGKSTVAGILGERLNWDVQEGDDLHPPENVEKMAAGQALTDADRWPWLDRVAAWITAHTSTAEPGIITCSALKKVYRDRLRGPSVVFVHLAGGRETIGGRLTTRTGHFMPSSLLDSQIETLEPLGPDENGIVVDVGRKPTEVADDIIRRLDLAPLPASS